MGGGQGFVSSDKVGTSNVGSTPYFTAERVLSLSLTSGEYKTSSLGMYLIKNLLQKRPSLCTNPPYSHLRPVCLIRLVIH